MTTTDVSQYGDFTPEAVEIYKAELALYPNIAVGHGIGDYYDQAPDLDALLEDMPDAVGLMEYTGKVVQINSASLRLGEAEGRPTVFAVIQITDMETGEQVATTTGAGAVLKQINRAYKLGLLPFQCKPYQVGLGVKGRTDPLHLGKVDRY